MTPELIDLCVKEYVHRDSYCQSSTGLSKNEPSGGRLEVSAELDRKAGSECGVMGTG